VAEAKPRRTLWKTALKALAAALAVAVLLLLGAFLCATPQVRESRFGERMEQRFPIGWSRIALAFGSERERCGAVNTLWTAPREQPPPNQSAAASRGLRLLETAAQDPAPEVDYRAIRAIACEVARSPQEVRECLVRLCHHPNPGVHGAACSYLVQDLLDYWGGPQRGLVGRLRNADAASHAQAAGKGKPPARPGLGLSPQMARALQDCLLGSAPDVYSRSWQMSGHREYERFAARITNAHSFDQFWRHLGTTYAGPEGRVDALILLWRWRMRMPKADRLLQEELAAHPLTGVPSG